MGSQIGWRWVGGAKAPFPTCMMLKVTPTLESVPRARGIARLPARQGGAKARAKAPLPTCIMLKGDANIGKCAEGRARSEHST
jgi:hypothetical protein